MKNKKKFFDKINYIPFLMQYPSPDLWIKDFSKFTFLDTILDSNINNLNLYIHIPFCDYLCKYCSFSKILANHEIIDKYLLKLEEELDFWNKILNFSEIDIDTIFIGGGTPTILNNKQIEKLGNILNKFGITTEGEFSIETNPDRIGDTFFLWKNIGVNRISIGQQTFNENILKSQNRNFISFKEFKEKIHFLMDIGFENINIDMIYGWDIKNHVNVLENDLKLLLDINPEHISFYPLILYHKKLNNLELANFFDKLETYYDFIQNKLENYYNFYTLEYAIKNKLSDNYKHIYQVNYLKGKNILGLGPSGFSFLNNIWFKNFFYLNDYLKKNFFVEYSYFLKNTLINYQRKFIMGLRLNIIDKNIVGYLKNKDFLNYDEIMIFEKKDNQYLLKNSYRKYQNLLLYYFNHKFNYGL